MKKSIVLLLGTGVLSAFLFAASAAAPGGDSEAPSAQRIWLYSLSPAQTEPKDGWTLLYRGYPATEEGERDGISCTVTYPHLFAGDFLPGIKERACADLGFSPNEKENFLVEVSSGALKQRESVNIYWQKRYRRTDVLQTEQKYSAGWKREGGVYHPAGQGEPMGREKTASVWQAVRPGLKMEYRVYPAGFKEETVFSGALAPYRTAYLEYVGGKYTLVHVSENAR